MNKIKIIVLSLLLGLVHTSCVDMLFDNENPDKAANITAEVGLPVIVYYAAQVNYDHAEYYIYLSQCLTTTGKSQTSSYGYKSGWEFLTMNRHPQWRRHYYDIGANINELVKNAERVNSPNYILIARTIRLMSTQLTTDAFGDMPLTEAYQSNAPHYDSQASIYKWMLDEADALIKDFENKELTNAPTNQNITINHDRVYAGDLNKWKGLVYAVKARILLRNIPNINTSAATCQAIYDAAAKAIEIWQADPMYGTFFGSEPRYNFDGGTMQQNAPWSDAQPVINAWESRANLLTDAVPSKFLLVDCMGVFIQSNDIFAGQYVNMRGLADDPRASLLFEPREGPLSATNTGSKSIKLRWLENNIGAGTSYKTSDFPNLYAGAYAGSVDAYVPLFTMEELYFIQAEAQYWMGNKAEACRLAKEATRYNIQRHLEAFQKKYPEVMYPGNVTANGYSKIDYRDRTEGDFTYSKARWDAWVNAFLDDADQTDERIAPVKGVTNESTPGNHRWFFNESEFSLSDLMMQKYVAMYMQPEQWTDMRRYHYSNNRNNYGIGANQEIVYQGLRRPYNLYAPYWVDGLSDSEKENAWIQRINYDPECEENYNRAELERLGAYKNYLWLKKPMIWSLQQCVRTSLTAE